MAFDYRTFKRVTRAALIFLALGTIAVPVVAAPLQYQSDRNGSGNGVHSGDANDCNPHPGRQDQGKASNNFCDDQPKYVLRGSNSPQRPGPSAFGLQFDTEGY